MSITKRITQLWSRRPRILGGQGYIEHLWLRRPKWLLRGMALKAIYRITVHGVTRLNPSLNPAQTFVANYPPCLQKKEIPAPDSAISTQELLEYLPRTGVIGQMAQFYYIFVFSSPYEPFIPEGGVEDRLFFDGGAAEPRNAALISFRKEILEFMTSYRGGTPQRGQWPLSVET